MHFKLKICYLKLIMDIINFYIILDSKIVQVVFLINFFYGFNDIWVLVINHLSNGDLRKMRNPLY